MPETSLDKCSSPSTKKMKLPLQVFQPSPGPPSKLCSPRAPRSAASAADAAASSTVTEPVAEVPRAVRGRRGKHGVRSTLEENEGSREDVERKRTADTNTGDREGDKERRNEPKGAGSTGSMEKKSYYQAPAKGQGSGLSGRPHTQLVHSTAHFAS